MRSRGRGGPLLLLLGALVACEEPAPEAPPVDPAAVQETPPSGPRPPAPPVAAPSPLRTPQTPAPRAAAPAPPDEPETPAPPLERLLRLPEENAWSAVPERPIWERESVDAPSEEAPRQPSLRPDVRTKRESSEVHPFPSRTRTEAGVAVQVDEDTSVSGGVRVEQEDGLDREEPVPRIGIERRF